MLTIQTQFTTKASQLKQTFSVIMVNIAQRIPQALTSEEIATFTLTTPHISEVATTLQDWISDGDLLYPFVGLSRFYQSQSNYRDAEIWLERCLAATQGRFGAAHHQVATSFNNLALLYSTQGRYDQAESYCLQGNRTRF